MKNLLRLEYTGKKSKIPKSWMESWIFLLFATYCFHILIHTALKVMFLLRLNINFISIEKSWPLAPEKTWKTWIYTVGQKMIDANNPFLS